MTGASASDENGGAYLAEYEFAREGIRQDQRQRMAFLGFALAASGLILGLLMRSTQQGRPPGQVVFLVSLVAFIVLVAEWLTIRSCDSVASGAAYIRLFIEPKVPALQYQRRYAEFSEKPGGRPGLASGLGLAYGGLTLAFILAWFVAPIDGGRECWQTSLVLVLGVMSLLQAGRLALWKGPKSKGAKAWEQVRESEPEQTTI